MSLLGRLPPLPEKPHPLYPSLSSAVGVAKDADKGRKVVAEDRAVKVGEVVMVEKPNTTFFCPNVAKVSRAWMDL